MASVTITLHASLYDTFSPIAGTGVDWLPPTNSRPNLGNSLAAGAGDLFLAYMALWETGQGSGRVTCFLAPDQTTNSGNPGPDFSDEMEMDGSITYTASDGTSLIVLFGGADATEPYNWLPSNSGEVTAFATLVRTLTDKTLTVTFDDNQPAASPQNLSLISGVSRFTAEWDIPADTVSVTITAYDIRHRIGAGAWTEVQDVWQPGDGDLNAVVDGLAPADYNVQIRAVTSVDGAWSSSESVTVRSPNIAPGAPTTPNVSAGIENLTVTWFAPSSPGTHTITAYDLRHRQGNSGAWTEVQDVWGTGDVALTHTIDSLMADVQYQVQVRAVSAAGDGAWSASATAIPLGQSVPTVPTSVATVAVSGGFTVTWAAPTSDGNDTVVAYDARYRVPDGGWLTIEDVWQTGGGTFTYTRTELDPGAEYEVQVRAVNGIGNGAWSSEESVTTDAIPPDAPTILSLTPGDTAINVQFSPPDSDGGATIENYDVQHRIGNGAWTVIDSATAGTTLSYTITGLTNSSEYEVQVRAVNSAGDGAWSDTVRATPLSGQVLLILQPSQPDTTVDVVIPVPPGRPTITTVDAGGNELDVDWTAPDEEGTHALQYYDLRFRSGAEWTIIDRIEHTDDEQFQMHRIRGLANDVEYDVQVRAVSIVRVPEDPDLQLPSLWSDIHTGIPSRERAAAHWSYRHRNVGWKGVGHN